MILLLGATGYMGQAFVREFRRRAWSFIPLTRKALDYCCFEILFDYIRKMQPEFVINAAGHPGKPNVDSCEFDREKTLWGNTMLPQTISRVCQITNTPWGHISSGCIYSGAKTLENFGTRIVRNLNQPDVRRLFDSHPERFRGFSESDAPNFSFRNPPCNFYSGTKALAEEAIHKFGQSYIWRFQTPFNERDEGPNLISKLQQYHKVYDHVGSFSHIDECVRACLDLWEGRAAFGIYNLINPGAITTREIVEMIQRILRPNRTFEFWKDDEEFYRLAAKVPRANCILDASKVLAAGVRLSPIRDALEKSLEHWQSAFKTLRIRSTPLEPVQVAN